MIVYIYCLVDPTNREIRYVGLTREPERRMYQHIYRSHSRHLTNWIKKLRRAGFQKPEFYTLQKCAESEASRLESWWIGFLQGIGCRLMNLTSGGERAYSISDEYRKRLSDAAKLGIKEGRRSIPPRPSNIGDLIKAAWDKKPDKRKPWTAERNRRMAGIPLTEEHRRKVSESLKGKVFSAEHRAKISANAKRRWEDPAYREWMLGVSSLGGIVTSAKKSTDAGTRSTIRESKR